MIILGFMGNHPFLTIGILIISFTGIKEIVLAIKGKDADETDIDIEFKDK